MIEPVKEKCTNRLIQYINKCHVDMCTMPIRSESNQINKKSKKCEGPGQPVLLGPPKCECDMKYDEI